MNLGYLYQEKAGRLSSAGKTKEARYSGAKAAKYMPTAQAYLSLGIMDYNLSDKPAALADFRKAIELDATFRQRFEGTAGGAGNGGGHLRAILDDKEFLKQLLQ
jgi:tetratricopeptide (TPR) repeat protein